MKLCGMLGSDFEGERAAAALKITGLLEQAGLRWDEILQLPHAGAAPPAAPRRPQAQAAARPIFVDWRADLACCERYRSRLTTAEADYVDGLRSILGSGRACLRASDATRLATLARRIRKQLAEGRARAAQRSHAWA